VQTAANLQTGRRRPRYGCGMVITKGKRRRDVRCL
jgi:hypothetical protein